MFFAFESDCRKLRYMWLVCATRRTAIEVLLSLNRLSGPTKIDMGARRGSWFELDKCEYVGQNILQNGQNNEAKRWSFHGSWISTDANPPIAACTSGRTYMKCPWTWYHMWRVSSKRVELRFDQRLVRWSWCLFTNFVTSSLLKRPVYVVEVIPYSSSA